MLVDRIEVWYRYEDHRRSSWDGFEECSHSRLEVSLRRFHVIKHTRKGVWLRIPYDLGWKRWVPISARKRYACPTIEEARSSFLARKNKQMRLLKEKLFDAQLAIGQVTMEPLSLNPVQEVRC